MSFAYRLKNLADAKRAMGLAAAGAEREQWPRERIDAFQRERLGGLVEHASTSSPFYRALYGGRIDRRDVRLGAGATEGMARQPEIAGTIQTGALILSALVEGVALFAVVVCLLIELKFTF